MDKTSNRILRLGVAFAFLYPPYAALMDPTSWLGYFPRFVLDAAASVGVSDLVVLHAFGVVEVLIALWLLSGYKVLYPAALAAAMLMAIVVFDFNNFEVIFRDISIAAAALALAVDSYLKEKKHSGVV